MKQPMDKAILTCALTGVLTDPKQHPVPVTPAQMAAEARDAFNAGASIMHVHLRSQEPGMGHLPSWDPDVAEAVVDAIRAACPGVIINLTTGVIGKDISRPAGLHPPRQARDRRLQRRHPELPEDQGRRPVGLAADGVRQPGGQGAAVPRRDGRAAASHPEFECFDVGIVRSVGMYLKAGMLSRARPNTTS